MITQSFCIVPSSAIVFTALCPLDRGVVSFSEDPFPLVPLAGDGPPGVLQRSRSLAALQEVDLWKTGPLSVR